MEDDTVVDLTLLEDDEVNGNRIKNRIGKEKGSAETETVDVVDVTDLVSPEKRAGGTQVVDDDLQSNVSECGKLRNGSQSKKDALKELVNIGKELRQGLRQRCQERLRVVAVCGEKESSGEKGVDQRIVDHKGDGDCSQITKETVNGKKRSKSSVTEEEKREKEKEKAMLKQAKKIHREFQSDKYVLTFLKVIMHPRLMTQPLGLAMAQKFQSSGDKGDHEKITYEVSDVHAIEYPCAVWSRRWPSEDGLTFVEKIEPFIALCFEAKEFIDLVHEKKVGSMLKTIQDAMAGCRINIIIHRLQQYIEKQERVDHRKAMSAATQSECFSGNRTRKFLSRLLIERSDIDVFDVSSTEEASNHICAFTKAIAVRHKEMENAGAKYLAGKSKSRTGSKALETLLVTHPLPKPEMKYPLYALCALPSVGPRASHALIQQYQSLRGLYEMLSDSSTPESLKQRRLENMLCTGGESRRIGPKASKQLMDLLMLEDPMAPVYPE